MEHTVQVQGCAEVIVLSLLNLAYDNEDSRLLG